MLLISGGRVLDPDAVLRTADLLVDGDRIAAVGESLPASPDAEVLDASGCIVLPGLVNAHTHSHNNLTRGLAGRWTLEDQLNHGPAMLAGRSVEDDYLSAMIGAIEMVRTGTTACYDLFMAVPAPTPDAVEAVVRAYGDLGLRAVVAPALADIVFQRTVPGLLELLPPDLLRHVESLSPAPTDRLLSLSEETIRRWDGHASGRIRVAVAPTIPGQCTDDFLRGCLRLVREHGVGLHTHLAETKVQVVEGLRRWGTSLVARLDEVGLVGPGFVGAHGVWLTEEDMSRMAAAGAAVAHNPASNLRIGSGIAAVREMLDAGLRVGIGTDGSMSSDNQDMFEAMRLAALVNRVRFPHHTERWLGGAETWELATAGSAAVLGMAADLGALAPGRKADVVLVRAGSVHLQPLNDPISALVFAETGASVDSVLVDGRLLLRRGELVTVDEGALLDRAAEAAARFRVANRAEWELARRLTPYLAQACRAAVQVPYPVNRYAADTPVGPAV